MTPRAGRILAGLGVSLPVVAVLYALAVPGAFDTYDGPWHLLCGRLIVEAGAVPRADSVCYTTAGLDWVNLNWLAQVVLYRVYQTLGFAGLKVWTCGLFVSSVALVCLGLSARRVTALPGLLALGLSIFALELLYGLRPRSVTGCLFVAFVWLLGRPDPEARLGKPTAVALLLGLWSWNNLHGGFVYGYCLLGMDLIATTVQERSRRQRWVSERATLLAGTIGLGLLGFAVHPHGFDAPLHALHYASRLGAAQARTIGELMPLTFVSANGRVLEVYLLVAAIGVYLSPRRLSLRDALLVLPFLHVALVYQRGLMPLILVSAPVAAEHWSRILRARSATLPRLADLDAALRPALRRLPVVLGAAFAVWAVAFLARTASPGEPNDVSGFDEATLPVAAARFLQAADTPGRIFNTYDGGGLLGWALYPGRRIYIDGRGDLHARGSIYANYLRTLDLQPGWRDHLREHDVDLAVLLVPPHDPAYLARELVTREGWTTLHYDALYAVLRRPR